jgi:hypothetical protein
MTTTYAVADGFDVADMSLNTLVPQPRCPGIRPTRRSYAASGAVLDEGNYVELIFSMLESVTSYQAILTQFGLNNADTNEVTVRVRDKRFTTVRMNGLAICPVIDEGLSWSEYLPRDIVILVRNLETAA